MDLMKIARDAQAQAMATVNVDSVQFRRGYIDFVFNGKFELFPVEMGTGITRPMSEQNIGEYSTGFMQAQFDAQDGVNVRQKADTILRTRKYT